MVDRESPASRGRTLRARKFVLIGIATACLPIAGAVIGVNLSSPANVSHGPAKPLVKVPVAKTPQVKTTPSSLIAALSKTTAGYRSPGGPVASPVTATWHGSPLSLPVIATRADYLEVRLPTRPNGSTTWILRSSVRLYSTPYRILVNLATRHLMLYRDNKLILDAPAGIGSATDPTPTGHFFVAAFAQAPSREWGPFVLVTSAHSNAISDWEKSGDAIVAIHGPLDEAQAIGPQGAQISHGCVRLRDRNLLRLRVVPDGSPVDIVG